MWREIRDEKLRTHRDELPIFIGQSNIYPLPVAVDLNLRVATLHNKVNCEYVWLKASMHKSKSTKYVDTLSAVITSIVRGPPCTYCPNLSSKFRHITFKQPSNSLPFLYWEYGLLGTVHMCIRKYAGLPSPLDHPPHMSYTYILTLR